MNFENLWEKLRILLPNDEPFFTYSEMVQMLENNPSEQIVYMDLLFRELSIKRMQQLIGKYRLNELSLNYFHLQAIDKGWHLMKVNLNAPMKEYKLALNYLKITKIIHKRNITVIEAKEALHILLLLAEEWLKENVDDFVVNQDDINNLNPIETTNVEINSSTEIIATKPMPEQTPTDKIEKSNDDTKNIENVGKSQLLKQLRVLQSSSKESVADSDTFDELRRYMHIKRPIQSELESILSNIQERLEPQLILLCGSVGDGKSHLLAYMKENHSLLNDFYIHNDSTESFNPSKDSLETLESVLGRFDNLPASGKNTIIAINLGVLHNFYNKQRSKNRFTNLCNFIEASGVFNQSETNIQSNGTFHILNYSDYQPYELTSSGAKSSFFTEILEKITAERTENPFYNSWVKDKENGIKSIEHQNFGLIFQPEIRHAIISTLVKAIVQQKVIVSTRSFYNFLYDIIVPVKEDNATLVNTINYLLPNLLFGHPDRSQLLESIHKLDPVKYRSYSSDQLISEFMLSINLSQKVKTLIEKTKDLEVWSYLNSKIKHDEFIAFSRLLIRQNFLLNQYQENLSYHQYINYLFHYYKGNEDEIGTLFELIYDVLFKWKGSPKEGYIFIDSPNKLFRIAYPLQVEPAVDQERFGSFNSSLEINKFIPSIGIGFEQNGKVHLFELDYSLYDLLIKMQKGYRPNRKDILNAIQFSEFYESLIRNADKTKNMLLVSTNDGTILELKKPKFSSAKYEVKQVY